MKVADSPRTPGHVMGENDRRTRRASFVPRLTRPAAVLALLTCAQLLALTLWFSANAVVPELEAELGLDATGVAWVSNGVIVGFVAGGLLSSLLSLADRWPPQRLFAGAALLGAVANSASAWAVDSGSVTMLVATRIVVGVALAGVYPVGMKMAASWFKEGRGLAIGLIVGALGLGSGAPWLLRLIGLPDWQAVVHGSSLLAAAAGVSVIMLGSEGPHAGARAPFSLGNLRRVIGDRGVRLATYGYLGHMWELYAMWVWLPVAFAASYAAAHDASSTSFVAVSAFLVFLAGGLASAIFGRVADRTGRTRLNAGLLAAGAVCGVGIGFTYGQPILMVGVAIVWGAVVLPDSPQYSAMVTELADPDLVGTALTLQTALGFLLTTVSIRLLAFTGSTWGWETAFLVLVPGPLFGIAAMLRLRRLPEAGRIAGGRR